MVRNEENGPMRLPNDFMSGTAQPPSCERSSCGRVYHDKPRVEFLGNSGDLARCTSNTHVTGRFGFRDGLLDEMAEFAIRIRHPLLRGAKDDRFVDALYEQRRLDYIQHVQRGAELLANSRHDSQGVRRVFTEVRREQQDGGSQPNLCGHA